MSIQVATVILAGGQGTRLHPLTIHHSKPAVSYGGKYRLIDIPISNSINSGYRQIFVIAQYLASELQHYISETYRFDSFNPGSITVLTPEENEQNEKQWFNGTADAVRKNLSALLKSKADYFLILSGDQLYNINFQPMIEFAQKMDADLTIATTQVQEKEALRMGILKTNQEGNVVDFIEKPKDLQLLHQFRQSNALYHGSMGIYVFKKEALISLLEEDQRDDFGHHLICTAVKQGKTYAYFYDGYWEDIGTVASYYEANLILTERDKGLNISDEKNPIYSRPTSLPGPKVTCTKITKSILCDGCTIEASEISHSVIGLRTHIRAGTIIRDSVLMGSEDPAFPPIEVGENCLIERAILDENVRIGNNVKLTNEKKLDRYEVNGLFIRDGIIIVTSGTVIPDNFVL